MFKLKLEALEDRENPSTVIGTVPPITPEPGIFTPGGSFAPPEPVYNGPTPTHNVTVLGAVIGAGVVGDR